MSYLDVTEEDRVVARKELQAPHEKLGVWVHPDLEIGGNSSERQR
jgi:hypothetical protein